VDRVDAYVFCLVLLCDWGCLMETRSDLSMRLRDSQGFVVESARGRFGTVDGFSAGGPGGVPDCLVVRAGLLGRRRVLISVDDVSTVAAHKKRIRLRSNWMTIET
jgi:hypothetical protein